jgi:hypothetical protein
MRKYRTALALRAPLVALLAWIAVGVCPVPGEVILQYFNTSWDELAEKMPELAEAGYGAIWLPPPTKGSGGLSVGYDCWDPFDLGSKDQRGSVRTRYGTEEDLLRLVRIAHRFGLRVYVDNIMNHRAFDVPGYNANTPIDIYPGMVPEDFHLRVTSEGFYRKWDNIANWSDTWQIQYRNFSDLIDIAQESPDNGNFGTSEGEHIPKIKLVRHPDNPEYYCYYASPTGAVYVGFGSPQITKAVLTDPANAWLYEEDVGGYLMRAARWLVDRTKIDGLRLDAVKHVPDYFFGQQSGGDKDTSGAGYCGQAQEQFNLTRGFSDPNHRDTVFETQTSRDHGRDDLMMFGEHLGEPPDFSGYIDAGMRLVDSQLHGFLNGNLGSPWGTMEGLEHAGGQGFSAAAGVGYIKSHDDDYATRPELQYALILLRQGLPCVYTDGNYQAETLGESGGAFPRHANTAFLGQFGDSRIPNLVYIHDHFARGPQRYDAWGNAIEGQIPQWGDGDVVAFERRDKRENAAMSDADGTVLFFVMNDNFSEGQYREIPTTFPAGSRLWQYATGGGSFYYTVPGDGKIKVITPPGGYFAFSWRNPEPSDLWAGAGGNPVTLYENGRECGWVSYERKDGPDGDPGFNPYGVSDADPTDFAYTYFIPRVSSGTNLRFVARVDGSAANVMMKLDGGIDLNGGQNRWGGYRDNPPVFANDVYLGYENCTFAHRQHREKFAARDTDNNNVIGSDGAEAYAATIGDAGFTVNTGVTGRDSDEETASWVFHDPQQTNDAGQAQFHPAPQDAADSDITLWVKVGYQNSVNTGFVYYTTSGSSYPEGSGGSGVGEARTVPLRFDHDHASDDTIDWWRATIPAADVPAGTELRYKIGLFRQQNGTTNAPWSIPFPISAQATDTKKSMMGVWQVEGFNAETASLYPHNDYRGAETGLREGLHVLRARAFLERDNRASIYNTFVQSFYYDASRPSGEVKYPGQDDTLHGNAYGVVVRTDRTVTDVWYHIDDASAGNDDGATGSAFGNGTNAQGQAAWVRASEVTPAPGIDSPYPGEWRFTYRNIPPGASNATLRVRLLELSSSTNMGLGDAAGHFTTLERRVTASGPSQELFFQWPPEDGMAVRGGWTTRVRFSIELGDGISDDTLRDRFLLTIDGAAQGKELYRITRDIDGTYGQLEYDLPNLFDGDPEKLHHLKVTHTTGGGVTLEAHRFVRAEESDTGPHIDIITPPEFDSDGKAFEIVLADVANPAPQDRRYTILVETDLDARHTWIEFTNSTGSAEASTSTNNPTTEGNRQYWRFLWTNMTAGSFTFRANVNTNNTSTDAIHGYAIRNTTVILRETVTNKVADLDDDDDGLYDADENTPVDLPDSNSETWNNGNVHVWMVYGRTGPLLPDTDGDKLPDGLESGWRVPIDTNHTDVTTDTNGDGYPNFIADRDPPFFNTVPDNNGLPEYVFNDSRTRMIHGTLTDPNNPDTDYDGIADGVEDANRNGWVDGDGNALRPDTGSPWDDRPSPGDWPDGKWDAAWTETDPNNADTDGDGAQDGHGEDKDADGAIGGDSNSNRAYDAGEAWTETNPLNPDTDGDGLPDGWEIRYELDPLNDGVVGHTNMGTGLPVGEVEHGPDGNPDGDTIVVGGSTNEYTNLLEYQNGTNPRRADTGDPPPAGSIVIGRGDELGEVAGKTLYEEFTDWSAGNCLVLDEYEGAGLNNQSGDLYLGWDGWDSSRDLVAFYAHDGQDAGSGGDGRFYFRADFHDLKAQAEDGNLDLYVVIDFNSPDSGEMKLPDEIDTITHMKWEAVVVVYGSSQGAVYVDRDAGNNTSGFGQSLTANGVERRDQADTDGFLDAYFNHELDAVEFSISRQALIDAGWRGSAATNFNYQVFTTKDGTGNDPRGSGDIGGRSDIRDSIYDDWIAEDYWQAQQGIESELRSYFSGSGRAGRAKVSVIVHGNQAIQPGCRIQDLVNTGSGAGYYRPLDPHAVYGRPLNLHVTPTLASAIEWAAVDPTAGMEWRDGPALNRRIGDLVQTNIVNLMGSTFSDHILPYFVKPFNRDNETLAREFLETVYRTTIDRSRALFWTPERVLDSDTFEKIADMGYGATVLDQNTHIFNWYGREESLRDGGYRINRIDGIDCFVINDIATSYLFDNEDGGAPVPLRTLFNRKARSGTQDQVITVFSTWEAFTDNDKADAYDANIRWIANRPWVALVTLEQIAADEVDTWGDPAGDAWGTVERASPGANKQAHNWLNHATRGDYDHWYVGAADEESLQNKRFEIRPGTNVSQEYGMTYSGGMVRDAWDTVQALTDTNVSRLARAVLHASVLETAFHDEDNHDLRRYSTGQYMYPATSSNGLASFAANAQAQTRSAALYAEVDRWMGLAATVTAPQTREVDIDLDGETEFVLYNDRVLALFERTGGRLVAAWARDPLDEGLYQAIGNLAGYAGIANEEEGTYNVAANGDGYRIGAYRTSALKDWWDGSRSYVNDVYDFAAVANGWRVTSSDGTIQKTVTLAARGDTLEVAYEVSGELYVRNGLSPNLADLLLRGQRTLGALGDSGGRVALANTNYATTVAVRIGYGDGTHSASFNATATDEDTNVVDFTTINMRNQAQTHQVELHGVGTFGFSIGLQASPSDWDGDGMPNLWEDEYGLNTNALGGAAQDADGDGVSNGDEYLAGTGPLDGNDYLHVSALEVTPAGVTVRFPSKPLRRYTIRYDSGDLKTPDWRQGVTTPLEGTGGIMEWLDDGSETTPHPLATSNRYYRIGAQLP